MRYRDPRGLPVVDAFMQDARFAGRLLIRGRATRGWTAAFLVAELALATVLLAAVALGTVTTRREVPTDAALRATAFEKREICVICVICGPDDFVCVICGP